MPKSNDQIISDCTREVIAKSADRVTTATVGTIAATTIMTGNPVAGASSGIAAGVTVIATEALDYNKNFSSCVEREVTERGSDNFSILDIEPSLARDNMMIFSDNYDNDHDYNHANDSIRNFDAAVDYNRDGIFGGCDSDYGISNDYDNDNIGGGYCVIS